jgi:hypothetical protein
MAFARREIPEGHFERPDAPAIGNIRRVGGIIVTAKVSHYDRKSSWTFRSLNEIFAAKGDTLQQPLIPGSPPATRINWVRRPPWVVQPFSRRTLL